MIGIIDYGMGNLRSIAKAVEHLGFPVKLVTRPGELKGLNGMILPGVGAFPQAMTNLQLAGFPEAITAESQKGKLLLGICLGMQILFNSSEEIQHTQGLGLLPGQVQLVQGNVKIPHMGWNRLNYSTDHPLWRGVSEECYVYFVHSFALGNVTPDVIATVTYEREIPVAVARENILGVQFHPEKSGKEGLQILKNFGEMVSW